jgi:ubiquinone/menaquinone biosynthesis C-methylase UbiE
VPDPNASFVGSIPAAYDDGLGPVIFAPYADDLATRVTASLRDGRLLEIACGTGVLTRRLDARLAPAVRITASDLSDAMLAHARANVPGSPRLEWQLADASALPFPAASFDAVACQFGIMFVPDKLAALSEVRRVLRPGGTLHFSVWGPIEENPFARIVHAVVGRFFRGAPPTFYELPFGYHDQAVIRAHLEQAGFSRSTATQLALEVQAPEVRRFARGLVEGNPVAHAIREAGLQVSPIIEAVAAALVAEGGDSPFRCATSALAWSARN